MGEGAEALSRMVLLKIRRVGSALGRSMCGWVWREALLLLQAHHSAAQHTQAAAALRFLLVNICCKPASRRPLHCT